MRILSNLVLLTVLMLLAAGCPRDMQKAQYEADSPRTASYPWEMGVDPAMRAEAARSERKQRQADGGGSTAGQQGEGEVELPAGERWPALGSSDTIDELRLPGNWLRVAFMSREKMGLLPPEYVDRMTIRETGTFSITPSPLAAKERSYPPIDGAWDKVGPGLVELAPQGVEAFTLNAELYRDDFLFFWNGVTKESFWYIRVPQTYSPQILKKSFETSLGTFTIGAVMQNRFDFTVTGAATRSGSGFYEDGILRMRWEDEKSDSGGFGVLITNPDWSAMKGAWWIDDYESAPYGGVWDMLADSNSA